MKTKKTNMKTRKISILFIAFIAITNILVAQPNITSEERAKMETDWMKTDLNLDASTALNIEAINLKYATKRKEMMQEMRNSGGEPDREAMRENMQTLNEEKNNELKLVLTQEQYVKYLELAPEKNQKGSKPNSKKKKGKGKKVVQE